MRPFTPADLPTLIELRADDEVTRFIGGRKLQNPEAIARRIEFYIDCYARYGYAMCAMSWKETGEMIGWSGLQPLEESGETEVGYGMIKEFWGRGVGTEAARAWLRFGFLEKNLPRIVAVADPQNAASRRIMEKCGLRYEKTEDHYGFPCVFYAVTRAEFLSAQPL